MNLRQVAADLGAGVRLAGRLAVDPRVPRRARLTAAAAVAYAIAPVDVLGDRIPVIGRIDDVFVLAMALQVIVEAAGADVVAEVWPGSEDGLVRFRSALDAATALVPERLRRSLRGVARP